MCLVDGMPLWWGVRFSPAGIFCDPLFVRVKLGGEADCRKFNRSMQSITRAYDLPDASLCGVCCSNRRGQRVSISKKDKQKQRDGNALS
jgi:hypothetical protein